MFHGLPEGRRHGRLLLLRGVATGESGVYNQRHSMTRTVRALVAEWACHQASAGSTRLASSLGSFLKTTTSGFASADARGS
jgi:hypothetical protein